MTMDNLHKWNNNTESIQQKNKDKQKYMSIWFHSYLIHDNTSERADTPKNWQNTAN